MGVDSYLNINRMLIHVICVPQTRVFDEVGGGSTTYVVSFPRVLQEVKFPVTGCPEVVYIVGRLCEHFIYRHFKSKVALVQEGTEPLPHCYWCGMHMSEVRLIRHRRTAHCNKNTQMRWRRRYFEIEARFLEATFILIGEEEA